ncbi:hypothetical protein BY458DRAFT_300003 [Sporodiniella umbellata]|nr:hypothetical protein BY458DRAFT_300003 [Sporodiniella umbellata]
MSLESYLDIAEHSTLSLLTVVADLLEAIIKENDKLLTHANITHFHSKSVPNISVHAYLTRVLKFAPFSNEVLLSILIYFDRIVQKKGPEYAVSSLTVHRLLITRYLHKKTD